MPNYVVLIKLGWFKFKLYMVLTQLGWFKFKLYMDGFTWQSRTSRWTESWALRGSLFFFFDRRGGLFVASFIGYVVITSIVTEL